MRDSSSRKDIPRLNGLLFFHGGKEFKTDTLPFADNFRPPRHMLVCGHARGGTSAVAGVLLELGLTTEDPNPFLESVTLRRYSKSQDIPGAIAAIRRWDQGGGRHFWKEPKLKSAVFHRIMPQVQDTVGFVFVFRDPLNVALRNDALGGIGGFEALLHAENGTRKLLTAIAALKHRQVVLVSYEKLLTLPQEVTAGIALFLGVTDPEKLRSAAASIEPNSAEYRQNVAVSKRAFTVPPATRFSKAPGGLSGLVK